MRRFSSGHAPASASDDCKGNGGEQKSQHHHHYHHASSLTTARKMVSNIGLPPPRVRVRTMTAKAKPLFRRQESGDGIATGSSE